MRICGLEEQIHVIDNKVTVEEIIKDIVRTKVIFNYTYFITFLCIKCCLITYNTLYIYKYIYF